MGRRGGGKPSVGGTQSTSSRFDFNVLISDVNGNEIIPQITTIEGNIEEITNYTFQNVIEDLSIVISNPSPLEEGFFDTEVLDNFGGLFRFELDLLGELDLTARYLPAGTIPTLIDGTSINDPLPIDEGFPSDSLALSNDRLEYIISSSELEDNGISELVLFIDNPGQLRDGMGEDPLPIRDSDDSDDSDPEFKDATADLESVVKLLRFTELNSIGDDGLSGVPQFIIRGESSADSSEIASDFLSNVDSGFPILLDAEDMNYFPTMDGYRKETLPSGDEVVSRLGTEGEVGTIRSIALSRDTLTGFPIQSNSTVDRDFYDLNIGFYDEDDGNGRLEISIVETDPSGALLSRRPVDTIQLDQPTGVIDPTRDPNVENAFRSVVIENVYITPGEQIEIRGFRDGGEQARIDYVDIGSTDAFDAIPGVEFL